MNVVKHPSRILGIAFLLQFITSFGNGVFLKPLLIVPDNISETMMRIAQNAWLMRTYILVDMLTALGVTFLGAVLYFYLRKQNEILALAAFGFYILEGALLAASKIEAISLLSISQEFVAAGQPAYLQTMAHLALQSCNFVGLTLAMVAFCPGGIIFYYLLYKSNLVFRPLSLWGLIAVLPVTIATGISLFGGRYPMFLALPYVPFELVIGMWLLIKGVQAPGTAVQQPGLVAAG